MKKENLSKILLLIEKWCSENNLSIFYGSVDKNNATMISWSKTASSDWQNYLTVAKSITKVVIIDKVINDLDDDDDAILDYKEDLEKDELIEFENALKVVSDNKGLIAYFKLYFLIDNVSYSYTDYAEWVEDYLSVLDAFSADDEDNDNTPKRERLSTERIEVLARMVTTNKRYLDAKSPTQRRDIAESILEDQQIEGLNMYIVRNKTDDIFDTEIKPKIEEELRQKVLDLKLKGLKKVEISSKLNISMGMVNKFYFTDNL